MEIKAGDIIGFSGDGPVSDGINLATWGIPRWHLSHVGIVAKLDGRLVLFESTSLSPADSICVLQGKRVVGVQAHELDDIYKRPGRVWHYPLSRPLTPSESRRLTFFLVGQVGRGYDMRGAGLAGGGVLLRAYRCLFKRQSLDAIFCSELTAAAVSFIGVLPTGNASAYNPNSFVRRARRAGVYQPRIGVKK